MHYSRIEHAFREGYLGKVATTAPKFNPPIDREQIPGLIRLEDVRPGLRFQVVTPVDPCSRIYEVLAPPYQDEDGDWWVRVRWILSSSYQTEFKASLGDYGITPSSHHGGQYTPHYYCVRYEGE